MANRSGHNALLALLLVAAASGAASADALSAPTRRHLLDGIHAFQAGRYDTALVEFRFVARAADAPDDLAFYLGPTLYKLGRHAEAAQALLETRGPRDTLSELYLAQTLYQLRLFLGAREVLVGLRERNLGPRHAEVVARYLALIDGLYAATPPAAAVHLYLTAGARELDAGRVGVAELFHREARAVTGRLAPAEQARLTPRVEEAERRAAALRPPR